MLFPSSTYLSGESIIRRIRFEPLYCCEKGYETEWDRVREGGRERERLDDRQRSGWARDERERGVGMGCLEAAVIPEEPVSRLAEPLLPWNEVRSPGKRKLRWQRDDAVSFHCRLSFDFLFLPSRSTSVTSERQISDSSWNCFQFSPIKLD